MVDFMHRWMQIKCVKDTWLYYADKLRWKVNGVQKFLVSCVCQKFKTGCATFWGNISGANTQQEQDFFRLLSPRNVSECRWQKSCFCCYHQRSWEMLVSRRSLGLKAIQDTFLGPWSWSWSTHSWSWSWPLPWVVVSTMAWRLKGFYLGVDMMMITTLW